MGFVEGFGWGVGVSCASWMGPAPGSDLAAHLDAHPATGPSGRGAGRGEGLGSSLPHGLGLFAGHGIGHLRLGLDWARLEPSAGHRDTQAVEEMRLVLTAAVEQGLSVWGCLHDGSLPGWFSHDEHGWADTRSRGYYWARHVEFVAETFGDLVHGWVPVFEPSRWASRGWLDGSGPPGRTGDAEGFAEALEGAHLAAVEAALRLREGGQPVASAQWMVPVFPARDHPGAAVTPEAEAAASVVDEVLNGCWLRMLTEQTLQVPGRPPVEVPGAQLAFDLVGFTYRHAVAVQGDGALFPYPQTLPTGPDQQVAWAEGLGLLVHHVAESLPDRPLLLAGVGLATTDEDQRERYLRDALSVVEEAVTGGIPLRGAWWDTAVGATRGLFDSDLTPRPAAELLAAVAGGAPVPT